MNSKEQITYDMALNGVRTPFLLDDGTVSDEYGTLGKGMHAGLPGHSSVLIDADGNQRWYGEYPSMWPSPRTSWPRSAAASPHDRLGVGDLWPCPPERMAA
jgi:hypothetical protein